MACSRVVLDFCRAGSTCRRNSRGHCLSCPGRYRRTSCFHLPEHYRALFAQAVRPHDDWLHHLIDEQHVVRAEVPAIQSRCRHTRVVVLPLDVDQPEATRVEALLELLLEVAELIDITARSDEHTSELPSLMRL